MVLRHLYLVETDNLDGFETYWGFDWNKVSYAMASSLAWVEQLDSMSDVVEFEDSSKEIAEAVLLYLYCPW